MEHELQSNLPFSEQFRIVAKQWVEADEAASLMEETKTTVFAEMVNKQLSANSDLRVNRAEVLARSSLEWKDFVEQMVRLRSRANLLKVQLDYLRMKFSEQQSHEATARAEMRSL